MDAEESEAVVKRWASRQAVAQSRINTIFSTSLTRLAPSNAFAGLLFQASVLNFSKPLADAILLLNDLIKLVGKTNDKVIETDPDTYFLENVNFFTKSFMVVMCAYLESYLKEASALIIEEANLRLKQNTVPYNLIRWGLNNEKKLKEEKFEDFSIQIDDQDLDEEISGNVGKTISIFRKLGIDLNQNADFTTYKDRIGSIVAKRNSIVHYNDDASDISLNDIIENIEVVLKYIEVIDGEALS